MIAPIMADVSLFISYASISLSTMVPYHERKNHPDTTPARNPMVPALRMLPGYRSSYQPDFQFVVHFI